ncbi:phage holin family protein [Gemmatimonas sp.]|uniref:phage holin family protein n=2 Tax=Gemmatimonas sp. TaxID=1962908 RepID=UPI00391B2398
MVTPHDVRSTALPPAPPRVHRDAMHVLLRLLINAFALWCAAQFVDGIRYTGSTTGLLGLSLVFGVMNAFIRPVLQFFSLPVLILTLGLFALVLNAAMLLITSAVATRLDIPFHVDGFGPALVGALLVSIVATVLGWMLIPRERDDD